jgi:uncharacterized SAM-binding protein YcdF (DUF218 family)
VVAGLWAGGFWWFVAHIPTRVEDENTITDAIVVLTGGSGRLITGITLLEQGKAKKLLISGVGEKSTISDLQHLSEEMLASQVKPLEDRIMLGHMAYSTQTNAIETAIWMQLQHFKSLRLVTANYHIPRSMAQFQAEMPDVHIVANPVFPAHFKPEAWWKFSGSGKLLASEYMKFLAVKLAILFNLHVAPIPKSH